MVFFTAEGSTGLLLSEAEEVFTQIHLSKRNKKTSKMRIQ